MEKNVNKGLKNPSINALMARAFKDYLIASFGGATGLPLVNERFLKYFSNKQTSAEKAMDLALEKKRKRKK